MIYIHLDGFYPDYCNWLTQVYKNLVELEKLVTLQEKKDFIDKNSIWQSGKSNIKEMLLCIPNANKCWYSESKENVSDYHIEHFRPKKEVESFQKTVSNIVFQEEKRRQWTSSKRKSDGYWWLAFDYKNYRICGSKINSSFKRNFFPIRFKSNFIAESPNQDYQSEEIVLLDPTKKEDPQLLTFEADGKVIPTYWYDIDEWKYTRAAVSIIVYGLNDIQDLISERLKKWNKCKILIDETEKKYQLRERMINTGIDEENEKEVLLFGALDESIEENYIKLKNEINPSSEFSAVAVACLRSFDYQWIKNHVLDY